MAQAPQADAPTPMPVKKTVTLLLDVQNKDVPVVITDLANFRLELTERVDFGSAQTVVKWLDDTYGSGAPGGGGTKIQLPPITDVPPPLRTLYMVFTNAHVWLDALMVDRKTEAFKFGVSIDFTQTPIGEKQLDTVEAQVNTEVKAAIKAKATATNTKEEDLEKNDQALAKPEDAQKAKDAITKPGSGGWEILPGIKIKGLGVMFERPPKPETTQPAPAA